MPAAVDRLPDGDVGTVQADMACGGRPAPDQ